MKKQSKKKGKGFYEDYVSPVVQGASNFIGQNYQALDLAGNVARDLGYGTLGKSLQHAGSYGYNKAVTDLFNKRAQQEYDLRRHYGNNPQFGAPSGVLHPTSIGGYPGHGSYRGYHGRRRQGLYSGHHQQNASTDWRDFLSPRTTHLPALITRRRRRR